MKVLVIGDIMLDLYTKSVPVKISDEAPVLVARQDIMELFLGGAGNVAANLASVGAEVTLCGTIGEDFYTVEIEKICRKFGITMYFTPNFQRQPNILKQRIICREQQVIRLDVEPDRIKVPTLPTDLTCYDVIVISDYNKGTINEELVRTCVNSKVRVVINGKPQNLQAYSGADTLTVNQSEYGMMSSGHWSSGEFREYWGLNNLVVTQGADGITAWNEEGCVHVDGCDVIPLDITGAGDVVAAMLAYGLALGKSLRDTIVLANKAAGCKVLKAGTQVITKEEIGL